MPETLNFTGDAVTFLGFAGVTFTVFILITIFRAFWSSPMNR